MSRTAAWFVHLSAAVVALTGVVYGWMRYFCDPLDELAVVNHPWEPATKAWHIVLAPLLVFAVGLLWRAHIWGRIVSGWRPRRRAGIVLAASFWMLVLSGYLIQVIDSETGRVVSIWTHALLGTLWLLVYVWHQMSPREAE